MTSTGCWIKHPAHLQYTEETNPLFSSWQNEMKSRSKASSPCNNSHQVSSGLRGLSLLLPRWHQCVCCYRSPVQHCNGKLLKEFLSRSQSSSISTAKRANTSRITLNIKIGTCLAKICLYHLHSLPTTTGGLQKRNLGFQKSNSLLTSLSLYFSS